ncbi:hypothetical protein CALCODRAFT_530861 [Calocera cornea HHB12733]|uniref:Vacuolar membrane protein n=1 Tax=Calocera cornea HHB12733 TaxID=1353952 RepID=A0A165IM26_9BASI|nr:hypothetical protein CALCODRAFT_530861 [Calocera cornea HHB12733]
MTLLYDRSGHSFIPRAPLDFELDPSSCSLLGPTALVVQALMGALVLLSLVYKRHRERPKRAWWIWAFDVGKQVVGQASIHVSNIIISWVGASNGAAANACSWYLVNILVDTTLAGVGLIYIALQGLTNVLSDRLAIPGLVSGEYGHPPKWSYFFRQLVVYLLALAFMKITVLGLFALVPDIMRIGDWMLGWTASNWALQVVLVMGIVPITMNVLQFWLIDSIVMSKMLTFAPAGTPIPQDPIDEQDPLIQPEGVEGDFEEDGPTLTGRKILDDLEAQRANGTLPDGKFDSPGTSASSGATIRPPPADRRSSASTVESYHLRPISRESSHAGSSTHAGFKVPTLHVTKPSADWEWNAQDEWGEDPFEGQAEGGDNGRAGKKSREEEIAEEDAADDAWGSMDALDGPKAGR